MGFRARDAAASTAFQCPSAQASDFFASSSQELPARRPVDSSMLNEPLIFGPDWLEISIRLGAAAAFGMILGYDRERHGTDAGLRTHGIICLSGSVATVTALILWHQLGGVESRADPLRVIEGMAAAVGIVAAGLIFVKSGDVKNLTSAAHLWLTVTVGIACGAGYWPIAVIGTLLALFMLAGLSFLSKDKDPKNNGSD